jgi:2-amino-4-hydroxy-6-hydroxymethyldihydropteridine diphosphokinase
MGIFMKAAYLLIGGNLGDRLAYLKSACDKIQQKGINILRKSSVYETAAWGITDQPSFLNQVLEIETTEKPIRLLEELLSIEKSLGRERAEKNGARTIDIDILYFGEEIINLPGLKIPHERIPIRKFVLIPLFEMIPEFLDPKTEKTIAAMLKDCEDELTVHVYEKNQ